MNKGFTLVELSIVLVIIGLIVGGVLVGKDLIEAATVRAQISQLEKYQLAANTFRLKYGYLAGDIPDPAASGFGLTPRGTALGQGDGNGVLQGYYDATHAYGNQILGGEPTLFWVDLTTAQLIDQKFSTAVYNTNRSMSVTLSSSPAMKDFYPSSKINQSAFIHTWSGGVTGNDTFNYFEISAPQGTSNGQMIGTQPSLTTQQAYNIDTKVDDGKPQAGRIMATYIDSTNNYPYAQWAGRTQTYGPNPPYTSATAASSTSCFDNGNATGVAQNYSVGQNDGNNATCMLSIRF